MKNSKMIKELENSVDVIMSAQVKMIRELYETKAELSETKVRLGNVEAAFVSLCSLIDDDISEDSASMIRIMVGDLMESSAEHGMDFDAQVNSEKQSIFR